MQERIASRSSIPRSIIVAVDGSESSLRAVKYAGDLAALTRAEVTLVHASLIPQLGSDTMADQVRKELNAKAELLLSKTTESLRQDGVVANWKIVETDTSVVKALIDFADSTKSELIITGTRGVSGHAKMVLGSVAAGVVGFAHCPVLTVR